MQSHYDVLKIALDAPVEVVRAAYRVFAARHHPDRAGAAELALMQRVNEAYRVLSDPALRAAHDAWIRAHRRRRAADTAQPGTVTGERASRATANAVPADAPTQTPLAPERAVPVRAAVHALPDHALLAQRAQRRRVAAAYAAHAPAR